MRGVLRDLTHTAAVDFTLQSGSVAEIGDELREKHAMIG
jgi:hypothetical protein